MHTTASQPSSSPRSEAAGNTTAEPRALPDVVMRYDRDGRYVFLSDTARAVGPLAPGDVLGRTDRELGVLPPDQLEAREAAIRRAFDTGEPQALEVETGFSGAVLRVHVALHPEMGADGGVASVLGIARDVTSRHSDRERLRAVLETAMDGFWFIDMEGRILEVNRTYCEMSGYAEAELVGMHVSDLAIAYTRQQVVDRLQEAVERGGTSRFGSCHRRRDGTTYEVEVTLRRRLDICDWIAVSLRDISGRLRTEEALRQSEARHRTILTGAMDGFWVTDNAGRIVEVNETYCAMSGYTAEELTGMHVSAIESVENPDEVRQHGERMIAAGGGQERFETRHRRKDGTFVDVEVSLQYRPERGGYFAAFLRDVTRRNRSSAERRRQEERHRTVLETAPDGFVLVDLHGAVVEVNDAMCRMTGYTAPELVGRSVAMLEDPAHPVAQEARAAATLAAGEVWQTETSLLRKDGSTLEAEIRCGYSPVEGGFITAFVRDILERKQFERELRRREELYRTAVETSCDGYLLVDTSGRLIDVNQAYCEMTGYAAGDLLGSPVTRVEAIDSPSTVADRIRAAIAGHPIQFETRHRRKDGSEFDVEMSIGYSPGNGGVLVGFVRDITQRKRAEAERAELEAQFRQSQKMETVGRLAGGVAHDFNNMLQVILGRAEIALSHRVADASLREDLEEILWAGQRSSSLTRQLLTFARKQIVTPATLDINEAVGGMLKMLKRLIGDDIELVWRPSADPWLVRIDPSQVDQVLANLCVNARDAIEGVGTVTIETGAHRQQTVLHNPDGDVMPGEYVRVSVRDTGCGMSADTLAHLFEPFYTTKGIGRGSGLGLSTVYGVVMQNGGFIDVRSQENAGTTIDVYLPRHQGAGLAGVVDPVGGPTAAGNGTVLLVEDHAALLKLAVTLLRGQGYRVLAASSPSAAIGLAEEAGSEIDVILTDLQMPEMNGRALADLLRQSAPKARTLFMSGDAPDMLPADCALGPDDLFLQKPFRMSELAAAVGAAIHGPARAAG